MNRRTFLKLLSAPVAVAVFPALALVAESPPVFTERVFDYNKLGIAIEVYKGGERRRNAILLGDIADITQRDIEKAKILLLEWSARL